MITRFLNLQVFVCVCIFLAMGCGLAPESREAANNEPAVADKPLERFGLLWEAFDVDSGVVASGQSLSHILSPAGMTAGEITLLAQATHSEYDVRNMRSGKSWWIAYDRDSSSSAAHFIYQRNAREYARFSLQKPYQVTLESLPADTLIRRTKGTIENSLYVDLDRLGAPTTLALAMANVYAWTVDFSRLQKGDEFDVMYERTYINGEPMGMPRVIACNFQHRGKELPAFRFDQGEGFDYFDEAGQSLRKAFLKAPVEFSRISSRYNLKRFHPILQKTKAHYGTDYAAPKGTPIISVGDGVVSKSSYTKGNGKYVKIRHNNTYETQYLHMSRRAVSAGERVTQGQVIGYVGSTGLATGPHVCFRFWKNGKQVDHLREEFPPSTPIMYNQMEAFQTTIQELNAAIGSLKVEAK
ncbi:MAG: peptidase M23 [Crocinitomicaceae bacterium]|jgi:murein DD-endopeptidase MepM/ murein hydrolase activator NlpD|nr:peptidase M23 [Crocinitomicaceae bacterium]